MNRCRQPRAVTAEIDDALGVGGLEASDPDYVVVSTVEDLERVSADILGERDRPIVGLTLRLDGQEPVLRSTDIRVVVGAGIRIYLIAEADLLRGLRELLGSRLRLDGGAARIWWPGASARCDPADHPVVVALDGEDYPDTLAEFAQEFDLSRPHVRSRVRVIEDARGFLEHEIARVQDHNRRAHERLRDAQIESHRLRTRAEVAEASLAAARPRTDHD
jgi:hypothetical protein